MTTYAVKWREPDGRTFIGRLVLGPGTLRLEGRPRGAEGRVNRQFRYEELQAVRIGTRGADRLDGRPALVVERPDGVYLVADAGLGAPIFQELVDRLAALRLAVPCRATVVVPLDEQEGDRVRELVAHAAPFDPSGTALTRHELLLTSREAIFVFEAETADALRVVLEHLDSWIAAGAWGELVAGPTRLADLAYAWERPEASLVPAAGAAR